MNLAWLLALVLQGTAGAAPPADAKAEFLGLEEMWNTAHVRGDADALDALWDAELVVTVPRMPAFSRADVIGIARSGRMKFETYNSADVRSRLYGDVAIAQGRIHRLRRVDDKTLEDHWLFTKVYVRREGQWKVVAFHASDAPQ